MPSSAVPHSSSAFEHERHCNHADRESSRLLDDLGDDWRGACARASTHSGCDEHHVGVTGCLVDLFPALASRLCPEIRVAPDALALREQLTNGDSYRHVGAQEGLRVRIDHHVFDARESFPKHPRHGVRTTASNSYDFDIGSVLRVCVNDH